MQSKELDLVIKNGSALVDGVFSKVDIGITGDKITRVTPEISADDACEVIDAAGSLVVPGLIDMHTHVYWGATRLGINPDKNAAVTGVTTWVDAGTAGAGGIDGLFHHVKYPSKSRIVPFLNISFLGLNATGMLTRDMGELLDPAYADLAAVFRANDEFPNEIKGIKLRASVNALGDNAATVLPQTREAADALQVPLMVHVGTAPPTIDEVLPFMKTGDILTHCFHPHPGGSILNHSGQVRPSVRAAIERGVLLDVGHGAASLSHETTMKAMSQGIIPDTISSDLHAENIEGPVIRSLLTIMEMFLALGMSIEDVFLKVTATPAQALGRTDLGVIKEGAAADIAIFRLEDTERIKQDAIGHQLRLNSALVHQKTIIAGEVLLPFSDGRQESRKSPWLARFGADMDAESI